ncbi:MAG TPA: ADP/ATP-dependent (S)-NAD(P)H-hydrate dehydratase [Acidimicrobiales bacterium]|nr:ADP/ATP-dependent (S)-NAD(P)H-hydrate dehydratase [Acidimicrobiales bacterium]
MTPLQELLRQHPLDAPAGDKQDRGTVLIVGGPPSCPGAIVLAGTAALRAGAGRIQLVVSPAAADNLAATVPEAFVTHWDPTSDPSAELEDRLAQADAVVIGPGYSEGIEDAVLAVAPLLGAVPLVLDAGALPAARHLDDAVHLVVAPNTAEAAALLDDEAADGDDIRALAEALVSRFGRPLAVRGRTTVVADAAGGRWHHASEAIGLGTAGSGDVLMGALGALLARGLPTVAALGWSVALHARAGEVLGRTMPVGYLAREIADHLPHAVAEHLRA